MSTLDQSLTNLAAHLSTALGLRATTNPNAIVAPCLFLGAPALSLHTAGVSRADVPVYLVAPGSGDDVTLAFLRAHGPKLLALSRSRVDPTRLEVGGAEYPAYLTTITTTYTA